MGDLDPVGIVLRLAILLFSVVLHEVAHGYVAYLCGDNTARDAGRLTLNPIPHIDPIHSIIMPIALLIMSNGQFMFGGAKPVPVNPYNLRKPRRDDLLVSVAGVTVNLILAIIAGIGFRLFSHVEVMAVFFSQLCFLNCILLIFNMLPIPPLDGSHVLASFLSPRAAQVYAGIGRYGFIIIVILLSTGLLSTVIFPLVWGLARLLMGF